MPEQVARAIFDADTPVISAVGHETDFTIADFVADLRAPTPSAAAELAVFPIREAEDLLTDMFRREAQAMDQRLALYEGKLEAAKLRLKLLSPSAVLKEQRIRLTDLNARMRKRTEDLFVMSKQRYFLLSEKLDALSPLKKLKGGYAYVTDQSGAALKAAAQVKNGDTLTLTVSDGRVHTTVTEVEEYGS